MKIIDTCKTFMRISNKGFEIIDVDINDEKKLKEMEDSKSWVHCIRTIETETEDKK